MENNKKSVVVGLSGGVDSATAAALLIDAGYRVIGVTLSMWQAEHDMTENEASPDERYTDAKRVADHLKIPWLLIDVKDDFYQKVVSYYTESLKIGITPNPCIVCNKTVKWQILLEAASQNGADHVATGHYARRHGHQTIQLLKAKDLQKDQSYFLSILGQRELQHTLFPLGEYTKQEVRKIAEGKKLPVAARKESQDLCFLGGMDQAEFITRFAPGMVSKGDIYHADGHLLGSHNGMAFYTIGQRKGINIAYASALYVIQKDYQKNRLIVGEKELLGKTGLIAGGINWVSGKAPGEKFSATVKIRYRSVEKNCKITILPDEKIAVQFGQSLRDITPGQALVMYQKDVCLGMGFIE
ncbi:MAG: tRNA 2-thiouridine(34) synthase MnmA [Anaerolineaceae bacterium]